MSIDFLLWLSNQFVIFSFDLVDLNLANSASIFDAEDGKMRADDHLLFRILQFQFGDQSLYSPSAFQVVATCDGQRGTYARVMFEMIKHHDCPKCGQTKWAEAAVNSRLAHAG
jgi:hypothetical protein